jgi:hypothetical protein
MKNAVSVRIPTWGRAVFWRGSQGGGSQAVPAFEWNRERTRKGAKIERQEEVLLLRGYLKNSSGSKAMPDCRFEQQGEGAGRPFNGLGQDAPATFDAPATIFRKALTGFLEASVGNCRESGEDVPANLTEKPP